MGIQRHIAAVAAAAVSVLSMAQAVAAPSDAALRAEAKVSQDQATATALGKVPHGKVKSVELEKENGQLVWSFDLAQPGKKGKTEIQVDAITGKIVLLKTETAAQEANEARAERKEAASAK